ncbi:hypothetical protein Vafri_7611 [Volvox africanus]|uniref:Uncharacterized protein n=1 Tax=Volvox africanus TaxID=51714 RepID=A0A8J4EXX9_9CHLO|nr:hypothetical protein Vafri_7611 [Volvox africanus]
MSAVLQVRRGGGSIALHIKFSSVTFCTHTTGPTSSLPSPPSRQSPPRPCHPLGGICRAHLILSSTMIRPTCMTSLSGRRPSCPADSSRVRADSRSRSRAGSAARRRTAPQKAAV